MPLDISLAHMIAACSLAFFAGFVKGITGFAMPMIMISGIGSFLSAEIALAGLILPTLVTNIWQAARQGLRAACASAYVHRRFLVVTLICLVTTAQFVTLIPSSVLFLVLGLPVCFFATIQLVGWRPRLDPEHHRTAELSFGAIAGGIGGLSGIWGPPTAMYLTALNIAKTEHVRIQGVVYSLGACALCLAHLKSGILNAGGLYFSSALIAPAVIGLAAGFVIQDRLDQERFRWAILIVLLVSGLNLIRRGMFG